MRGETHSTVVDETEVRVDRSPLDDLLPALQRLDQRLQRAVTAAQAAYGASAATDRYRGLYINQDEVERLLARKPGVPTLWTNGEERAEPGPDSDQEVSRLGWLEDAFGLSPFDMDLLLIALAPELDLRYERLYAYLQDDVGKKRPSVDLALNLLCPSVAAKLDRQEHVAADAPLMRHGLLQLIPDPTQIQSPLLTHFLKVDEQIVRFVLGQDGLDRRLAPFCQLVEPHIFVDELPLSAETKQGLLALALQARAEQQPLKFYFYGPSGAEKRRTAEALANEIGAPLLVANVAHALLGSPDVPQFLRLLFRAAWFHGAVLYLDDLDTLCQDHQQVAYRVLLEMLAEDVGVTILAGVQPWAASGRDLTDVISVPFAPPDFSQRRAWWQDSLDMVDITLSEAELDTLAGRFRLLPEQMTAAVTVACTQRRWRAAMQPPEAATVQPGLQLTLGDLFAAARAQCGHDLATLAHKIEPKYTWDDLILPENTVTQLQELCQRVTHRHRVLGEWGFDRKLSLGKGVNALFAGPSGTGKTMAADIIANALGLDLYKIDLSGVVSKWIGETEKNLDRIFTAAENANAILFFDEADALFGKRSEVHDSHDRYANIEISYLLQKMEEYDGIAILASNLQQNLDESFIRRMAFTVHFPFPDEASRRRIWAGIWPAQTPLATDVDLDCLAHQFKLSGGNIKNIALAAAFLAAEDGGTVTMTHLRQATRREYQKMGKVLSEAELNRAPGEA